MGIQRGDTMDQLEKDILVAKKIIARDKKAFQNENYSKIYLNTTENIKGYMPYLDGTYKSALLPTASGDHALEFILNGIDTITCYDINPLAKYYTQLKFCAIKNLSKEDYMKFMYQNFLDTNMFHSMKHQLSEDTRLFWEKLMKYDSNSIKNLFHRAAILEPDGNIIIGLNFYKYCATHFTRYLEEDHYRLIQDKIGDVKISYVDVDLLELPKRLDQTYDIMNFTNIYEYINTMIFDDSAFCFANAVKSFDHYLSDDGKMFLDYYYEESIKNYNKYKNKPNSYAHFLRGIMTVKRMWAENCMKYPFLPYPFVFEHRRGAVDKLNEFRNFQFLRYLQDFHIEAVEVPRSYVATAYKMDADSDLALIYKKELK